MGIKIVDPKVFKAILEVPYHRKMTALALWFAYRYNNPKVTSGYRREKAWEGDSGIHMTIPCRAMDWSIEGITDTKVVVDDINNHWEYDPERPNIKCAICHDVGKGMHLHTQVHDKTIFHEKGKESV